MTYLPPSAWHMTPAQRLARLRHFVALTKGRKGIAAKQALRYKEEIEQIKQKENQDNDKSAIH